MSHDPRHRVGDGFPDVHLGHAVFSDRTHKLVRDKRVRAAVSATDPQRFRQFLEVIGLREGLDVDLALRVAVCVDDRLASAPPRDEDSRLCRW